MQLPDDEEERINLLNHGKVLLLGGVLRLFVLPDKMDQTLVELLINRLLRNYGIDKRIAAYNKAAKIIFNERK